MSIDIRTAIKMNTIILGAGGHAKVIIDILKNIQPNGRVRLLDDTVPIGTLVGGCPVIGGISYCRLYEDESQFVIGIGKNEIRQKIAEKYSLLYVTLIHPSAVIGSDVELGAGSVVMAGVVINSGTRIGSHCIINTGATIDHDNQIGDFVHISPGVHLGGTVKIGERGWVGIGSCVKNDVIICNDVVVGAGGVVVKNIEEGCTVVGNPARSINFY